MAIAWVAASVVPGEFCPDSFADPAGVAEPPGSDTVGVPDPAPADFGGGTLPGRGTAEFPGACVPDRAAGFAAVPEPGRAA
ncbi:hypothetical protein [Nocardia miyunensis]|uniref:hypothetical protein n=1 Tax=Nocardia miyunensis TaxID=282684 RepID=UPI00082F6CAA|nr:hypothetical protein [Nocardia miyunensis]